MKEFYPDEIILKEEEKKNNKSIASLPISSDILTLCVVPTTIVRKESMIEEEKEKEKEEEKEKEKEEEGRKTK
jgi:hypothetical protein